MISTWYQFFLILVAFAATAVFHPSLGQAAEYQTFQEFLALFPQQVDVNKKFKQRVAEKAKPIDRDIQKDPVRIAFIYPGNQLSDYWHRSIVAFKKRMDEIGLRYELKEYFSQAGDIRMQEGQLRKALAFDPDYLVYTLDVNRHKRLIERLISKGRPKIILQNITTPLKEWHGKQPFMYVGFDHAEGTRLLSERLSHMLDYGTSYAVLFYSQGYVSQMRGETFIRLMSEKNNWQLKDSYYTDGRREKAKHAALEILADQQVKLIYSCSTDVAFGAIDALRQTNRLGSVIINGWGGGSEELQAVIDGTLDLTVMRINDDNGVAMAEAIRLELEGKTSQVPTIFSGDFVVVEKGISQQRLQALKERSFRYSGVK